MADLRITPRRLELLNAVAEGRVTEHYPLLPDPAYTQLDRGEGTSWPPGRYVRVTAEIAKLRTAGLVALDTATHRTHHKAPRRWLLTEMGERLTRVDGER